MAPESVAQAAEIPFLQMNARYHIGHEVTTNQMRDDVGCLLESVEAIVLTIIDALEGGNAALFAKPAAMETMLYGSTYFLEMAKNLSNAADGKHEDPQHAAGL